MADTMGAYFLIRRELGLSFGDTEQALGADRVEALATCRDELTRDDKAKLETFAGQRALEREQAKKGRGR